MGLLHPASGRANIAEEGNSEILLMAEKRTENRGKIWSAKRTTTVIIVENIPIWGLIVGERRGNTRKPCLSLFHWLPKGPNLFSTFQCFSATMQAINLQVIKMLL